MDYTEPILFVGRHTAAMKELPLSLLIISGLVLLWTVHRTIQYVQFRRRYRFPPQVPGIPIFGNLFQILRSDTWRYLKELSHKHGEMYVNSSCP